MTLKLFRSQNHGIFGALSVPPAHPFLLARSILCTARPGAAEVLSIVICRAEALSRSPVSVRVGVFKMTKKTQGPVMPIGQHSGTGRRDAG